MTKKQLEEQITKIRPKAYAYDRVCESLGIKNNILGYVNNLKNLKDYIREIKSKVSELIIISGLNVAHDYDGIESDDDVLLYLDALIKHYKNRNII